MTLVRNETQRHSAALKNAGQSPIGLFPLDGSGFAAWSFQLHPVFRGISKRVLSSITMSCFVGFGDISWDNFKNYCQTQGIEFFVFVPKGTAGRLWKLDSVENARFETQAPFSLQAVSCIRK